jgi:peptidoglycan/LPS O-acetylase OafA/YrhL
LGSSASAFLFEHGVDAFFIVSLWLIFRPSLPLKEASGCTTDRALTGSMFVLDMMVKNIPAHPSEIEPRLQASEIKDIHI